MLGKLCGITCRVPDGGGIADHEGANVFGVSDVVSVGEYLGKDLPQLKWPNDKRLRGFVVVLNPNLKWEVTVGAGTEF